MDIVSVVSWVIFMLILSIYLQRKLHKRKIQRFQEMVADLFDCHDEMQDFLRIGMWYRYKDIPLEFETFCANVIENYYGGQATVSKASGDFGVDFSLRIGRNLYLGQVKCYEEGRGVNFEPIALVHSQMQKQNAVGGYVITTSYFTSNAISYAKELGIELINGERLVQMYIESSQRKKEVIIPQPAME